VDSSIDSDVVRFEEADLAAGARDAGHLAHHAAHVGHVVEREAREGEVEAPGLERELQRVRDLEVGVREARLARDRARLRDHGRREVDAHERAHARGKGLGEEARAAADVEGRARRRAARRPRRSGDGSGSLTCGEVTKRSTCAVN